MRNGTFLTEALTQPSSRDSFTPLAAPFSRAWPGVEELTMFDWMNKPENKFRLMRFGNAMKGISGMTPDDAILRGLLAFFTLSGTPFLTYILCCESLNHRRLRLDSSPT